MIGIIGAMQEEIDEILFLCQDYKLIKHRNHNIYKCILANKEIILVLGGIGKVNASISTSILINDFNIDGIITIGVGGSLKENISINSVVIPDVIAQHDFDIYQDGKYKYKGFDNDNYLTYPSKEYIDILKNIFDSNSNFKIGPAISGDIFVVLNTQLYKIVNEFKDALIVDMEAYAIGKTCDAYNIKYVVVKAVSDLVLNSNNDIDYDKYLKEASKNSAIICQKFIEVL